MTAFRSAAAVNSGAARGRASSATARAFLVLTLAGGVTPLYAQRSGADSSRAAADSMALRLKRAEEAIALLQQQLAEQASAGVSTRSRMKLELSGRVLVHASRNDADVNNADDPQFVLPTSTQGTPFVMTARQSMLGAALTASDVLGGQFTGDIDVDFYGGQLSGNGGRTFALLRMRTARAIVRWPHAELLAGQEQPLIAGLNPVSPSAIGTPLFAAAGNLWLWLPQVRASVETGDNVRFGVQAAMLANITGDAVGNFDTTVDPAEHSGRPAGEARVRVRWGEPEQRSEIGCGGHIGSIDSPTSTSQSTYAGACDARLFLTSAVELRGEAYTGRGLRGLGGGGIGQNLNTLVRPLDDKGGWAQLNIEATPMLKIGGGCGIDAPEESVVGVGGRLRNRACAGYGILKPSGPLFLGFEARQIETKYAARSFSNLHLSFASGFEF